MPRKLLCAIDVNFPGGIWKGGIWKGVGVLRIGASYPGRWPDGSDAGLMLHDRWAYCPPVLCSWWQRHAAYMG